MHLVMFLFFPGACTKSEQPATICGMQSVLEEIDERS